MEPMGADLLRNVRSTNDLNRVVLSLRRGDNPLLYYRTVSDWAATSGIGALFPLKYWFWSQMTRIGKSSAPFFCPLLLRINGASIAAHLADLIRKSYPAQFAAVHHAKKAMARFAGFSFSDIAKISSVPTPPGFRGFSRNADFASEIVVVIGPANGEPGMGVVEFVLHWPVRSTNMLFFSLDTLELSRSENWKEADFTKISAEIRSMLAGVTPSRMGVVGVSAGGAPAMILGSLLNADYVIAAGPTSPQKFSMFLEVLRLGARSTFMEIIYASDCIKDEEATRSWVTLLPGISQRPIATDRHHVLGYLAEEQKLAETLESFMESLRSSKTK